MQNFLLSKINYLGILDFQGSWSDMRGRRLCVTTGQRSKLRAGKALVEAPALKMHMARSPPTGIGTGAMPYMAMGNPRCSRCPIATPFALMASFQA
jgi:hypothetical protein